MIDRLRRLIDDVKPPRRAAKIVLSDPDYQELKNELYAAGYGVAPAVMPRITYFDDIPCETGPETTVVTAR